MNQINVAYLKRMDAVENPMQNSSMYEMPKTEKTPSNIAVWAQFGIFSYLATEGILDLDEFSINSDIDIAWFLTSTIVALSLLFKVPYHRAIGAFLIPVGMGLAEGDAFYLFGILFFAPLAYLPSMAFDELDLDPPFGVWSKRGWGFVFFGLFLFFNVLESSLLAVAMDGELEESADLTEEYGMELQADCEASEDCAFVETNEPNQVETLWTASSMERNIAYIGIAMLCTSILAIVSYSVGILDMEMATPMNAGILFVGSFWADNYLWTSVQEVGWSGDFIFLIPMSGIAMMAIHGLFSKEMETTE